MSHTLLLADDSVTIQRVIELTFADEDVQVRAVSTGQQAIDAVMSDPPDIVLADVGMPERDGYEVASFIKGNPDLAHIPVLLLTGAFEPVDEARATAARCDGVLAKPFEPHMLISRVKDLLPKPAGAWTRDEPPPGPVAAAPGFGTVALAPAGDEDAALSMHALLDSQPGRSPEADVSLDDYFDRLDQAFASLAGGGAKAGVAAVESWAPPTVAPSPAENAAAVPLPVSAVPAAAQELRPVAVADVFSSILQAEAAEPGGTTSPLTVLVPPPVVSDELVERIVGLVIDRMADREVRQAVADTVSRVAERLVRDEIERLKALPR